MTRKPSVPTIRNGVGLSGQGEDGMMLVRVAPRSWTNMPFSIGVAEYRLAPGQVLAVGVAGNNPMGKPLYTFTGTPEQEKALPAMFKPQYAAGLSLPVGDFTVPIARTARVSGRIRAARCTPARATSALAISMAKARLPASRRRRCSSISPGGSGR